MRRADILVADIGSTLTKLSAFAGFKVSDPRGAVLLGQSCALTTVDRGNVLLGLEAARRQLAAELAVDTDGAALMAASSAAGGLRMTVHGLTQDMTLRAAREASLGAGAIVVFSSVGALADSDLEKIRDSRPKLILLTGGVDFGDRETVIDNAKAIARLGLAVPVIYAGNQAAREPVESILNAAKLAYYSAPNVYPRIDELNIEPVRSLIQDVFAGHIISAPGMEQVKQRVTGKVIPTPAAVLRATELAAEALGDVLTVDVGGSTTDVHSVTEGSPHYAKRRLAPEPRSKRTVEGDLGVYSNADKLAAGNDTLDLAALMALPDNLSARQLALELTRRAVDIAIWRHAGELRVSYGAYGRDEFAAGRDLTAVKTVIGTGGALIRLGLGEQILGGFRTDPRQRKLLPSRNVRIVLDHDYIMAAVGVLCERYPAQARQVLLASLGIEESARRA